MRQPRKIQWILLGLVLLAASLPLLSQDRFPRPEFESNYTKPLTTTPPPKAGTGVEDVVALVLALSLASVFALKHRSRKRLFGLMIVSLVYFGFIREGCVCSVGSIQNVALALADKTSPLPWTVAAFFVLPLLFALFFGRTFCAAVCPLGAAQDLVAVRHVRIPTWLGRVLGLVPYLYLGLALLFAATGSAFIICQYDPFVTLFRFTGGFGMILLTAAFLALGIFVTRPYCRFLCPYGVLLGWMSRLARRHVTVTPTDCVQCRLCEHACPVDAIAKPTPDKAPETRTQGLRRIGRLVVLLPAAALAMGLLLSKSEGLLSQVHPKVKLESRLAAEENGRVTGTTLETRTFRSMGIPREQLQADVAHIKGQYKTGGWLLGIFLGAVFVLQLIGLSVKRKRTDYEPDRATCVSCGRCFSYCPVERKTWTSSKPNDALPNIPKT